jgi:predicted ribosome quality control (RQC) complex YloA/Tae2 family protein
MELDATEETETLGVTEESTDEPETNNDDLMLGGLDLESADDNTDEEKHDLLSEKEEEDNGFDLTDEVVEESVSDLDLTEEVPSMEDILSQTIAKLTERQEHVLGEEEKENSHISKLEDQIKALEEEKLAAENTKKDLQAESKQISANITKLEKMKDSDTDKK